jgi:hypothetical protein
MYEDLDCFERALQHFGTRVDVIVGLEMGGKLEAETAYKNIKMELKELKKIRKKYKDTDCENC